MKTTLLFSPLHPTGGISSWTYNMLEYIQKHHIHNVYHVDASIRFKSAKSRSRFRRLWSGVLDTLILIYRFGNALVKYKPNCVHIATSASLALYKDSIYLWIASLFKVQVVFHYHFGRILELKQLRNWEWNKLISCVKKAKYVIVIDPVSYKVLCEECSEEKVFYIPNPCSPSIEAIAKQPLKLRRKNDFIFVGHVIPTKGVYELVKAFTRLDADIHLEIIGLCNEEMFKVLKNIASMKENGSWLTIVGNKDRNYVLGRMDEVDALILPSYTEGFPNVVLEAMACGCPVIATNVGAIADMLSVDIKENSCGMCLLSHNVEEICNTVKQYLEVKDIVKDKFARNGKNRVLSNYTMEKVFPQYVRLWNN